MTRNGIFTAAICVALLGHANVACAQKVDGQTYTNAKWKVKLTAPDGVKLEAISVGDQICEAKGDLIMLSGKLEAEESKKSVGDFFKAWEETWRSVGAPDLSMVSEKTLNLGAGKATVREYKASMDGLGMRWVILAATRNGNLYHLELDGAEDFWADAQKAAHALAGGFAYTDVTGGAPAPEPASRPKPGTGQSPAGVGAPAELKVTSGRWDRDTFKAKDVDYDELVWAQKATASSKMGSKQAAAGATGQPDQYPRHGVGLPRKNTSWLPRDSGSEKDWIELSYPRTTARQLWIFETNEPGCVWKVEINGKEVYKKKPQKGFHKTFNQKTQVFWLDFSIGVHVDKVKIWVRPNAAGFVRMGYDAVGIVPAK